MFVHGTKLWPVDLRHSFANMFPSNCTCGRQREGFPDNLSARERRDSIRFLWTHDVNGEMPDMIVLRFTRVVFGVNSSSLLLNATIDHE